MGDEHNLRPMKEEDWDRVLEMEQEFFEDDMFRQDQFINRVHRGNFFALEVGGQLVGELAVDRFGSVEGHLGRIGVARSHQRQGLGSMLMDYAIDWFRNKKDISAVHLYTQDYNKPAQTLYHKYGFSKTGTTWHYIVPFNSLKPEGKYTCHAISEAEIELVAKMFLSLPAAQIRRFLESDEYHVLTLKSIEGKIVGACRFTPSFPGSFPFEITSLDCFDDFIQGMKQLSLPEFDHVRTVFTDNEKLANVCEERDYHLHHKLFKMSLHL